MSEPLDLDDTVTFGKHKGLTVEDVMEVDPGWLKWAMENVDDFELDQAVADEVTMLCSGQRRR